MPWQVGQNSPKVGWDNASNFKAINVIKEGQNYYNTHSTFVTQFLSLGDGTISEKVDRIKSQSSPYAPWRLFGSPYTYLYSTTI